MAPRYLFPPPQQPTATVSGSPVLFPLHRVFCVGRNYHAHAAEMGASVDKAAQEPIYFSKHPAHVVASGAVIPYPPGTADFHHEVELVVALGREGFEVDESDAGDLIFGYACGLDMTRRDLQQRARKAGLPWDVAKDFENAAVLSEIVPQADCGSIERGAIRLSVNGELRQSSDVSLLIWSVAEIIAHLSTLYHLRPGDLIYTGTPEGVGAVVPGDRLHGAVEGVGEISLTVAAG